MFLIIGIFNGAREVLDEADTQSQADFLLEEYRIAFSCDWFIKVERA